jgi:hypothetical protein
MRKGLFDDLARTLATPMPRRQALRTLGATLAMGAFRALRPGRAAGYAPNCVQGQVCDSGGKAVNTWCCVQLTPGSYHSAGCCLTGGPYKFPLLEECCIGPNDSADHPNLMSWCCPVGTCGASIRAPGGRCIEKPTCKADEIVCGKACCKRGEFCGSTLRSICCKNGETACVGAQGSGMCCTSKQTCQNGKCCDKCGGNGTCCDPATTYCCREPGDPQSPGRCCKKEAESCCGVGPEGAQTRMCCPKPNKCVKQLPPGRGGFTKSSPWVCCPPGQQVPVDETRPNEIVACCAPGQVSLGGKLLVGQGIQGSCCDEDKICGSGANLTCCQTGQSCIGGTTCV